MNAHIPSMNRIQAYINCGHPVNDVIPAVDIQKVGLGNLQDDNS